MTWLLGTLVLASSAVARTPVYVFPIPSSHVAPPGAQIVFRGLPVSKLGSISVTGSSSGGHSDGKLRGDSDGNGGSFIPAKGFTPGETVTVTTKLDVVGGHGGKFSFTVAHPAPALASAHWPISKRRPNDVWTFHSRPDLKPTAINVITQGQHAPGDMFIASENGPLQVGPEVLDPSGKLIWFKPLSGNSFATDVKVQRYRGKPVLTWWQGFVNDAVGVGEDVINDTSYRVTHYVRAADGLKADLHEFDITPRNTALITAEYPVYANLSSAGGSSNGIVFDSVVQEIDIPTGLLLFQWDSLDHVPLTDSYQRPSAGPRYDYFHVNSMSVDSDGNLVISGRNTSAAYKVDGHTGRVIWILNGKRSSFQMLGDSSFAFQHDVRVLSPGESSISVFDNGLGVTKVHSQSRGLLLHLDTTTMTAAKVREYDHSPSLTTRGEGNFQTLSDGDAFLGWGGTAYFSEYDPIGNVVFDARFAGHEATYRAFRFTWSGSPKTRPAVAASKQGSQMLVYASWNGATNVSSWRVLGGSSAGKLHTLTTRGKQDFETEITVGKQSYVQVQALSGSGKVLGSSAIVHVH